jgi:hypothetical protein
LPVAHERLFKDYLNGLAETAQKGDAREESFYPVLATFIKNFATATGHKNLHVTIQPKPTEGGNPDFRVWDGQGEIVGYIEAKPPQENPDKIESTPQLKRYLSTFPNLILSNFLEFRLYRNGQRVKSSLLAQPVIVHGLKTTPPLHDPANTAQLLEQFLDFSLPPSLTAKDLAVALAKRTRFLRDIVLEELKGENERLLGFFQAFQKYLVSGLTPESFSDLYAQTITYGLFAARTRAQNGFSRRAAFENIPRTLGILRELFRYISLEDLPTQMEWIVDDIAHVLAVANVSAILDQFFREGKGTDPIVHFYETFLAEYDPAERERRGVYYTPEPVVNYIVRSIHSILKDQFGRPDGLASQGVTLLDPAAGTMTFVAKAAQEAAEEFEQKYGSGAKEALIQDHVLKNFYAFELMMAPYAVGHLKMALFLENLGHHLSEDERVRFYLTNTLDMSELEESVLPGLSSLAKESHLAGEVKKEKPILAILGNPPYSGHSANLSKVPRFIKKGEPYIVGWKPKAGGRAEPVYRKATRDLEGVPQPTFIGRLIRDYYFVDGSPLKEKNPKWLQDDYVKFLRFAQWKIAQAERGVVGMITNHSYLDNPTFRGMRRRLMQTFDEIYILDLHGNSLKKERCPNGSPDENVFDIRQGVAIAFFVKTGEDKQSPARVYHAELWGLREEKYEWLKQHGFGDTPWQEIHPKPEFYLFVPRDEASLERYNSFLKVTDIFPVHSVGIVTARDKLTIQWTPEEVWTTVLSFSRMDPELARQAYNLGKDVRDWKVSLAQEDLNHSGPSRDHVVPILYRPFDTRYTYYTGKSRGFHCMPRPEVMLHMLAGENVALVTNRHIRTDKIHHAWISNLPIDLHIIDTAHASANLFPLYLYPNTKRKDLFSHQEAQQQKPNLNPRFFSALAKTHREKVSPEQILHYIYAVLYAPSYRKQYAEFLRMDFPRIPFTADKEVFREMASLGKRLVELHLLKSAGLDPPLARFEGEGDSCVAKNKSQGFFYDPRTQQVHINKTQYFKPVPPEVWEYRIGGYQVAEKWLKDRRERTLSLEEICTYCHIITALALTIKIQEEMDQLYPDIENSLLIIN